MNLHENGVSPYLREMHLFVFTNMAAMSRANQQLGFSASHILLPQPHAKFQEGKPCHETKYNTIVYYQINLSNPRIPGQ